MIIIFYSLKVHEQKPNVTKAVEQWAGLAGECAFHQDLPGCSLRLALTDFFLKLRKQIE